MNQENCVRFVSDDRKVVVYCDSDTPLGSLHDILMKIKGNIVDRMTQLQQQEMQATKQILGNTPPVED